jgi:hypothetical protein
MRTQYFIATMLVAATISMARGFTVAAVLEPVSFAIYATCVAAGAFGSILLSFGSVEQTIKAYPRMWVAGHRSQVIKNADTIVRALVLRCCVLFLPLAVLLPMLMDVPPLAMMAILCVAISISCSSVYASIHRATTELRSFSIVTLVRASLSISLALFGAILMSWPGAILGETVAGIASALISRLCVSNLVEDVRGQASSDALNDTEVFEPRTGGMWLFFGFLGASIPAYLDRSFVAAHFGALAAAKYAFLLLFVTAANVLVGILAQKAGPALVQMERVGRTSAQQGQYLLKWILAFWAGWIAVMLVVYFGLRWGPLAALGMKYEIDGQALSVVAALGLLQVTVLVDFLLISRDRERWVFSASITYLLAALAVSAFTIAFGIPMVTFICLLAGAKLLHLAVQAGFVLRLMRDYGR